MKKHKNGFTLAEVLITLVIIGIIAAMTIPTLMNKTNEQETVVAVKKSYSTLAQAYKRVFAENGEIYPQTLGANINERNTNLGNMFAKQLSVQKNCGVKENGDCWSVQKGGVYKFMDGSDWSSPNSNPYYKVRLNDGSFVAFNILEDYSSYGDSEPLHYVLGSVYVDVNGDKSPNVIGRDVFKFWVTKFGILPCGTPEDTLNKLYTCRTKGAACTAWVIIKGNMDYLHKNVSW